MRIAAWFVATRFTAAGFAAMLLFASPLQADPVGSAQAPGPASDNRIITLAPSATELVYAAGAGEAIIGTVLSSDYPPAARNIPRIGDGIQFSDETILALHPTLVVGWLRSADSDSLARRLQSLGIPMIYAQPRNLDDIPMIVRDLGRRLGTQATAEPTARRLTQRIQALHPPPGPPRTVFIEVSSDPLYTLGHDPLIDDLLSRCGGVNPYASQAVAAPQVSIESVLHLNPDVMIMSPYGRQTLAARRAYWAGLGLRAALNGHIYAIDPDWLHRPGPRLVDAAEALCADLRNLPRAPLGQVPTNGLSLQMATG